MFKRQQDSWIPGFLSLDVEPDGCQLSCSETPTWPGYGAMFEVSEKLRERLSARSGIAPKFGWYFRIDPQIAEVYRAAASALLEFPKRQANLKAKGGYFGVHAHPIRWCDKTRPWVHDVEDTEWLAQCTDFALKDYVQ
jgi:hypothetical protein